MRRKMNHRFRPIVVLFHPDDDAIASLIALGERWRLIAVVNAIDERRLARVREAGIEILLNNDNIGLARAFNQGMERAFAQGADHVILLDQDTRPPPTMPDELLERADRFIAGGGALGCLGPRPVDRKRPGAATSARHAGLIDSRTSLVPVATIISSGMVIPRTAFERVGGMWNELFIDHVDHEWCFRAANAGLAVMIAPDIVMPHNMGDAGIEFLGRYKPIHRSSFRHYHLVRNTLWLVRCSFIPRRWRIVEAAKLGYRLPIYLAFGTARGRSLAAIAQGLRHGLSRKRMSSKTLFA